MKFGSSIFLTLLCVALSAGAWGMSSVPPAQYPLQDHPGKPPEESIVFKTFSTSQAILYTAILPPRSGAKLSVAADTGVHVLDYFARQITGDTYIINGGFFDPANRKTTSYILLPDGTEFLPEQNERLTQNPALAPYLEAIFKRRPELRIYHCGKGYLYKITGHLENRELPDCKLEGILGAGPALLVDGHIPSEMQWHALLADEGFTDEHAGKTIRDPLGAFRPNARSAIGIRPDGGVILLMAAQQYPDKKGLTLYELSRTLYDLGARAAMALDGGTSSAFYADGKTYYGKMNSHGVPEGRPVKSVLRAGF